MEWLVPYPTVVDYVRARCHSMPDPDGIPCRAWRAEPARRALYDACLCFFHGTVESLPADMCHSLMVFLPKGSDDRDDGP
eukprot:4165094-Pyramimonas_sp.AAC.1